MPGHAKHISVVKYKPRGIFIAVKGGFVREARMIKELVVRAENRVGLLAQIARLLSDRGINILAVSIQVEGEEAVIHVVTDAQTYARDALRDAELAVEEREAVAVELPHRPGFLRRVTEALARRDLDIRYLYSTAPEGGERSLVVFSCNNNGKAVLLLRHR
jgi:hypothetical protein